MSVGVDDEAVIVAGDLTIIDSTIIGNSAFFGGGIANLESELVVQNSTINGNTAYVGGGLGNFFYGYWRMTNSTVSGNEAKSTDFFLSGTGGGIFNWSSFSTDFSEISGLLLSTVTGNTAKAAGGGIFNYVSYLRSFGNLVSGNPAVEDGNEIFSLESQSAFSSATDVLGDNSETTAEALYGDVNLVDSITATSDGDIPTPLANILQTTLADNGGPTQTHALVADSPAIDYVPDTTCDPASPLGDLGFVDQRGDPRNIDIPGMGNDGGNEVCDAGAYELQLPSSGAFCPVDDENVAYLRTDAIGIGQGRPTKGYRTRKLVVPNSNDVASLYGQLASVATGQMKYIRFLPQGYPKVQIYDPTSLAYRPYAVNWWGSELPADANYVKGQFFWGKKGNKAPRAFVLWPTYNTDEPYANAFATFDESSENHVAWEAGFIPSQQQTVEIPQVQENGATVNVTVALVDVNKDGRSVVLNVAAGNVSEERVVTVPNSKDSLNLEEFVLEGVEAGTDQVVITLDVAGTGPRLPLWRRQRGHDWCGRQL